jgi:hypothetical protein
MQNDRQKLITNDKSRTLSRQESKAMSSIRKLRIINAPIDAPIDAPISGTKR